MTTVDLGKLPRWDLSNIYTSLESEAFKKAIAHLNQQTNDVDARLVSQKVGRTQELMPALDDSQVKNAIDGYLVRMNSALRLYETLYAYVQSFVTTDSYNNTAKRLESELELVAVRLRKLEVRFQGWLGLVANKLPSMLKQEGQTMTHGFYLQETADQSRYLMTEAEESLAAELELSGGNAWSKLQGTIWSQLTVPFERKGKVEKLPITAIINLGHDSDPEIRKRAYEVELAAWETVREPLASCLNGIKGFVITLNKRRGRVDALHQALDQARIDRDTLETMFRAIQNSFPVFRRYLRAKAKRLGHDSLPWWDLQAPVGKNERRYSWDEARRFILTQFRTFSERLANLAQRAFDKNWLDAEPRDGKRGGAFCMEVPAADESRILSNFDGSLDEVSTLAHELGHAFHNECQVGKTTLQKRTPMTLAETASTFNEILITNAALASASSPEEELSILETRLMGVTQVNVDIYSRFLFEKEVFEQREKSELSADDFCEIMLRNQRAAYGDGLDGRYLHKYMWAWKPHYYSTTLSFYNFPYAFGLLFGTGLYAVYQDRGRSFVSDYESLLADTGEATPAELAARFGIDIRKPDFWDSSLKIIAEQIKRYLEL